MVNIFSRVCLAVTLFLAASAQATPPLVDFQVYLPVLTPYSKFNNDVVLPNNDSASNVVVDAKACVTNQTLMQYTFAQSYGVPFVGSYIPPKCKFNRVTFNLTVTSIGRQYDRLGFMYFGSTEIWRTSTAEPTATGIIWTYVKDMSQYLSLFQEKQTLIVDIDNNVVGVDNGVYNATLTATFWSSEDTVIPADQIIPVSNGNGANNKSSVFTVPSDTAAVSVKIPKRTNRAVFSIAACGQINEEQWYDNVFDSAMNTFPGYGALFGGSPYRELQLYIDGIMAGIVLPFPIVFTGGIVPGLWRPIVGIDAFDLREEEIDITPWLGHILDGEKHTFEIRVAAINGDGTTKKPTLEPAPSYWLVTGKIFLWFDPAGFQTTGSTITYNAPAPSIHLTQSTTQDVNGTNQTLTYNTQVTRRFSVSSVVTTANGTSTASWQQKFSYYNYGGYYNYGFGNVNNQSTTGTDISSSGYKRQIQYGIYNNNTLENLPNNGLYLSANVSRSQVIKIMGEPTFPSGLQNFDQIPAVKASYPSYQGSTLSTVQNGTAFYYNNGTVAISPGSTTQTMTFSGDSYGSLTDAQGYPVTQSSTEFYSRAVTAVNTTVVSDHETLIGQHAVDRTADYEQADQSVLAVAPASVGRVSK